MEIYLSGIPYRSINIGIKSSGISLVITYNKIWIYRSFLYLMMLYWVYMSRNAYIHSLCKANVLIERFTAILVP